MTELKTIVELYGDDNRRPEVMETAGEILKKGGLVAFPTETVYGLGGDALNPEASARIYAAKGRPSDNPLIVHIADMEALKVLASEVPENARLLADRFWPGPLTIILNQMRCLMQQQAVWIQLLFVCRRIRQLMN